MRWARGLNREDIAIVNLRVHTLCPINGGENSDVKAAPAPVDWHIENKDQIRPPKAVWHDCSNRPTSVDLPICYEENGG